MVQARKLSVAAVAAIVALLSAAPVGAAPFDVFGKATATIDTASLVFSGVSVSIVNKRQDYDLSANAQKTNPFVREFEARKFNAWPAVSKSISVEDATSRIDLSGSNLQGQAFARSNPKSGFAVQSAYSSFGREMTLIPQATGNFSASVPYEITQQSTKESKRRDPIFDCCFVCRVSTSTIVWYSRRKDRIGVRGGLSSVFRVGHA